MDEQSIKTTMDNVCRCFDTFLVERIEIRKAFGLETNAREKFESIEYRLSCEPIFKSIRRVVRRCRQEHARDNPVGILCDKCHHIIYMACLASCVEVDETKVYLSGEIYYRIFKCILVWIVCSMCKSYFVPPMNSSSL